MLYLRRKSLNEADSDIFIVKCFVDISLSMSDT